MRSLFTSCVRSTPLSPTLHRLPSRPLSQRTQVFTFPAELPQAPPQGLALEFPLQMVLRCLEREVKRWK